MLTLKQKIEECVRKEHIDLIGFAGKDRFEGLDPRLNPFTIFPEGKTVIMLGKRICRGSLRGVEEGTNFADYNIYGKNWLEDQFLALVALGAFMPLVEFLLCFTFRDIRFAVWSFYPLAAFVILGTMLIFLAVCRPARETMERKFFV